MIYIAADHGGFELKNTLVGHLQTQGYEVVDMGAPVFTQDDDYPDFVIPALKHVQERPTEAVAILLCKNGVGVSMLANKFKGIRCALSWSPDHASSSRVDDNTNVLALPAKYIAADTALKVVDAWLQAEFSNAERHNRRLTKFAQSDLQA